jgi:SAM-dependent methyltransferase
VADLGCGPGVVTAVLSRALPRGRVYAVDVEPAQLDRVNSRITAQGLRNVVPVLCVPEDARLPDGSVDVILVVDTYHHFDDRVGYLRRLARALRPSGVIVNVDFKDGDLPVGPPPAHRIPRETMVREFRNAGLGIAREEKVFPYHDFLVFARENPWRAP